MNHYLTIDVGGTYIKYALMTDDIEIIEKGEVPTRVFDSLKTEPVQNAYMT